MTSPKNNLAENPGDSHGDNLANNPATRARTADSIAPAPLRASRVRARTMAAINAAAIEVFAREGLSGASTQAIAERAGLSKQQLHYYIDSKEALYRQVLEDVIDDWIGVFGFNDEAQGPRKVLTDYLRRKIVFSFEQPLRSRIFSMEMMRGAPVLRPMLTTFKRRTDQAIAVIQNWIEQGLMDRVDPLFLLFNIWAITQFYAEHDVQVSYYSERSTLTLSDREAVITQCTEFILRGAGVK